MRSMIKALVLRLRANLRWVPKIRIADFERNPHIDYVGNSAPLGQGPLMSEIARAERLFSHRFVSQINALGLEQRGHRKHWELAYILEALHERDLLRDGARGLGFAVGREPIPAFLAARGCTVLASDLPSEDERNQEWQDTGQWGGSTEDLMRPDLCAPEIMRERVSFRPIDMNDIPADLSGFDFTWSTCSFEHCGSLELGIRFLENQMKCLRPGGVAIHTTEFNLSSNQRTITKGSTCIFRLRDIEDAVLRLQSKGHRVEPLDVRIGDDPLDHFVDIPKYVLGMPSQYSLDKHIRLLLGNHVTTSIGLIITKASGSNAANQSSL
jgi:hypothetical protein